jgi:WD40 repeat protein
VQRALERVGTATQEARALRDAIAGGVLERERMAARAPEAVAPGVCPYKGLARYEAADAPFFHGRERLVATLVARMAVDRFVGVIGASGSGKSSLVRAGLLPALSGNALPGSGAWPTCTCTPGEHPLRSLAEALAPLVGVPAPELARRLDRQPDELGTVLDTALRGRGGARVVMVVDQFEEIVTLCRDQEERERFAGALVDAVTDPDVPAVVVPVVRADYFGGLAVHPELAQLFEQSQVLVGAMTNAELRRAITEPARRAGLGLEDALVEAVCADAGSEPGALPLVSTAMAETWVRRDGTTLALAGYREAGGVQGALARLADDVYAGLDEEGQALARRLFLRLAEPGEGTDDVRRRMPRDEFSAGAVADEVLDAYVGRRLLVADGGSVEVAHEALLREWPRLHGWLEEDRDGRRTQRHLTDAAAAWAAEGRDPGALYRGTRLDAALEWAHAHDDDVNAVEREFLTTSADAQHAELRRARRTARHLRRLTAGLTVLLVVALFAGGLALVQRHNASRQAARAGVATHQAQASRLVTAARLLPPDQVDLALLLGVEGRRFEPSVAAEGALEAALAHVPPGLEQVLRLSSPTTLFPALSRDSRLLAAPDQRGGVEIWDLAGGRLLRTLSGPVALPNLAFFNADASLVVDTRSDGMARVWDVASGRQLGAPLPMGGRGGHASFVDAHGARLVTATVTDPTATTTEGRVVVWDRQDPQHPRPVGPPFIVPVPPGGLGVAAGTSSDGRTLFVSGGTTTELWDVASHRQLLQVPGSFGGFTPDGASVATVEGDHISLWDPRTAVRQGAAFPDIALPPVVPGRPDLPLAPVLLGTFSPDGRLVAVTDTNSDGRVWVFDVASRRQVATLTLGPNGWPVAFLPDDRLVTAAGALVEVLRLGVAVPPIGVELGAPELRQNVGAGFAAGGTEIDTGGGDKDPTMRRWDGVTGAAKGRLLDARAQLATALFTWPNRAGTAVAVVQPDGRVHLWDSPTGEEVAVLDGHRGGEWYASWSPAGDRITTVGLSQSELVWDVSDLHHPVLSGPPLVAPGSPPPLGRGVNLPSDSPWLDAPLFSNDGRLFEVSQLVPGRVTLFDTATRAVKWSVAFAAPSGQYPLVLQSAFSPDDKVLAVQTSVDNRNFTVALLDVASGRRLRPLLPAGSGVGVAFLDGGRVLVTTSGSKGTQVALLWDVATLQPIGDPLPAGALGVWGASYGWAGFVDASPDGKRFLTQGLGPTLGPVLWDADPADWAATACRIAGRNLTRAEWDQYFQGRPYHATCPQWPPRT